MPESLDLALTVLDRQLIDAQGHRCGRVDDIELSAEPGTAGAVVRLLVGQTAASGRLPRLLRAVVRAVAGGREVAVPWADVTEVAHVVKLSKTAAELGLADGERRAARWLSWAPGAR